MVSSNALAATAPAIALAPQHNEDLTASSHVYSFARQRWQNGALGLLGGGAMLISGLFLLLQIPKTPDLEIQLAIIGLLMAGGGLWMMPGVLRDLAGSVAIDDNGIHMRPAPVGFSVAWDDVERWSVCDDPRADGILPALKVYQRGVSIPKTVPAGFLSHSDQGRLQRVLDYRWPQGR